MLAGLEMELDAAVNTFADFMAEIVPYERILVFFWDEEQEAPRVRLARGVEGIDPERYVQGNILDVWASRFAKPMLISAGEHQDADSSLLALQSGSALVVPIIVGQPRHGICAAIFSKAAQVCAGRCAASLDLLPNSRKSAKPGMRERGIA